MSNARNKVPLILMSIGIVAMSGFAWWKLRDWSGAQLALGIAVLVSYVVWLVAERRVSLTESDKGATARDRGSCELYAFGRLLTVVCALALPSQPAELGMHMLIGAAIFVTGVCFRLFAIHTLGQFYSHRVRLVESHRVIDTGPYRVVRHPAYTGMLVAHAGFVMVFPNVFALAALVLVLLPAMIRRILIEERALFELEGYARFAQNHKRLVPLVW